MTSFDRQIRQIAADLADLRVGWALVGGFAVSVRALPRTTLDLDLAITVDSDREAEQLVLDLRARAYSLNPLHAEQGVAGRLAMARMFAPASADLPTALDLLFASSGIEREVVDAAELLVILPGVEIPVAQVGHLVALKLLAGRPQDLVDVRALLGHATEADLELASEALTLIERRGFNRGKAAMQAELAALIQESKATG